MKTLALYFLLGCTWSALFIGADQARPYLTWSAVRECLRVLLGGLALLVVILGTISGLFLL